MNAGWTGLVSRLWITIVGAALLAGCSSGVETMDDSKTRYSANKYVGKTQTVAKPAPGSEGGLFGKDGLTLLGGGKDDASGQGGGGVGVNSYLWRASLDTISFMPLSSADPFGGVIITEWFSPGESPNERFKINVFILGRDLRADGVRAAVFRQKRDTAGNWLDAPVEAQTATDLENSILSRARQLRVATAQK